MCVFLNKKRDGIEERRKNFLWIELIGSQSESIQDEISGGPAARGGSPWLVGGGGGTWGSHLNALKMGFTFGGVLHTNYASAPEEMHFVILSKNGDWPFGLCFLLNSF